MLRYLDKRAVHRRGRTAERRSRCSWRAVGAVAAIASGRGFGDAMRQRRLSSDRSTGLNENYARELMELHTPGGRGGATTSRTSSRSRAPSPGGRRIRRASSSSASAVVSIRRWPPGSSRSTAPSSSGRTPTTPRASACSTGKLRAGRGIEDGEEVLDLLSEHPATARFLARKPRRPLRERRAASGARRPARGSVPGDLGAIWRRSCGSSPTQPSSGIETFGVARSNSPLELVASALRGLDADLERVDDVADWLERMGQPLYAYEAPTGYPDRADFWVNAGSLLNRMNFGLTLASERLRGVSVDLAGLLDGREPGVEARGAGELRRAAAPRARPRPRAAAGPDRRPRSSASGCVARPTRACRAHPDDRTPRRRCSSRSPSGERPSSGSSRRRSNRSWACCWVRPSFRGGSRCRRPDELFSLRGGIAPLRRRRERLRTDLPRAVAARRPTGARTAQDAGRDLLARRDGRARRGAATRRPGAEEATSSTGAQRGPQRGR